jgi:hypothetical protein
MNIRPIPAFAADHPWGAEPAVEADLALKRRLLARAGGRFCGVEFVKKDGSVRRMQVQPAVVRSDGQGSLWAEDTPARRAARTRALRHPHLLSVWDVRKRAPRTINLRTLRRLAVDGRVYRFAA